MLEAIIAIGILVTAVTSSLTLVQGAIGAESESENAVVAGNLAREAVEVVRSIRDANWLSDRSWDTGLEGTGWDYTGVPVFNPAANAWSMDFTVDDMDDAGAAVYRYPATSGSATEGLYVQAASTPPNTSPSGFRRMITLDAICGDGSVQPSGLTCGLLGKVGARVVAEVTWIRSGGSTRSVTVQEDLYDWR